MPGTRVVASLMVAASLLVAPAVAWSAADVDPDRFVEPDGGTTRSGDVPSLGWLSVAAPRAGEGIAMTVTLADGGGYSIAVETDAAGITRSVPASDVYRRLSAAQRHVLGVTGGPEPCNDPTFKLLRPRWRSAYRWWFRASNTPASVGQQRAERAITASMRSITRSRNDCGMTDVVGARGVYLGRTSVRPGVSASMCTGPDGVNVVGFARLHPGILGLTCTAYIPRPEGGYTAVESDVVFNRTMRWGVGVAGCSGLTFMLRSVATHEFGHVFGLGHVNEQTHGRLTMSTGIGPCDDSAFTLGQGDVLGLRKRY